jgi:hypothetical protein
MALSRLDPYNESSVSNRQYRTRRLADHSIGRGPRQVGNSTAMFRVIQAHYDQVRFERMGSIQNLLAVISKLDHEFRLC